MSTYVRYCKYCDSKDPEKERILRGRYSSFHDEDDYICEVCGNKIEDTKMKSSDYHTIVDISNNPKFVTEMFNLLENDIIEYETKMAQFRNQVGQQSIREENVPHCPTCGSTNIEKISLTKKAVGAGLFGLLSSNVRNTMHCKNCGAKW